MGRPSTYSEEVADEICRRLANGDSLAAICREDGMPSQDGVYGWLLRHPSFAERYAQARDLQGDTLADQVLDKALNATDPNLARVQIDALKWLAGKLKPKKYGDVTTSKIEVSGTVDLVGRLTAARDRVAQINQQRAIAEPVIEAEFVDREE